ncbi:hypothetical protein [Pseudoxanthomonas sp. JBR18]|uniref:hypothetical protein n=1 Tax=Pseudoxanthomonas sp. JBR18 TaxID=2969308 RepID=UPI00230554B8|nr:hypothetical protein [Pseudoxanthomonas sp. JBR18]WCE05521.1 hypothetical protein PJ250_06055 [Pseudoxanthomonas sp. JBR18]
MELLPKLFLLTALFAAASSAAALPLGDDDEDEDQRQVNPDNQARIRFFGQAVIGLEFYRNTMCYGGDAESETPSSRGFGGAFGSKKSISLGMPVTPNVINLKQRNGILAKAFYREYAITAGEPIAIHGSYYEATSHMSRGCEDFGVSFVPEKDQDYEVALDLTDKFCRLVVSKISQTSEGVALAPVELKDAQECGDE